MALGVTALEVSRAYLRMSTYCTFAKQKELSTCAARRFSLLAQPVHAPTTVQYPGLRVREGSPGENSEERGTADLSRCWIIRTPL